MNSALAAAAAEVEKEENTTNKSESVKSNDRKVEKHDKPQNNILLQAASEEVNTVSPTRPKNVQSTLVEAAEDEATKDQANIQKAALMVEESYAEEGERAVREASLEVENADDNKSQLVQKPQKPAPRPRKLPLRKLPSETEPRKPAPCPRKLPLRKLPSETEESASSARSLVSKVTSQASGALPEREPSVASQDSASSVESQKAEEPPKRKRRSQPKRRENQRDLQERVEKFKYGRVDSDDEDLDMPICRLAYKGDPYKMYMAIEKGGDINETDQHGWTALHWATSKGNIDLMEVLLAADKQKRETNANDEGSEKEEEGEEDDEENQPLYLRKDELNGWTPLHVAVIQSQLLAVQLLLDEGADAEVRDKYGDKPIDCISAMKKDGKKIIDELNGDWWESSEAGSDSNDEGKSSSRNSRRQDSSSSDDYSSDAD